MTPFEQVIFDVSRQVLKMLNRRGYGVNAGLWVASALVATYSKVERVSVDEAAKIVATQASNMGDSEMQILWKTLDD